jgi:hypothetical protein
MIKRPKPVLNCARCGRDLVKRYVKPEPGRGDWLAFYFDGRSYDERVVVEIGAFCYPCHEVRCARQDPYDLYLECFGGLSALPRFIELTRDYRWTPEALKQCRAVFLQLQLLPTRAPVDFAEDQV